MIRSRLRSAGVETSRLLDIIYPAREVIGLLVHRQYKPILKELLVKYGINTIDSFDPLDPKHVADPKYDSVGTAERRRVAVDLHRKRLVKGLELMRAHVVPAVARSYVEIGWIAESDVPERPDPSRKGHATRKDDDRSQDR